MTSCLHCGKETGFGIKTKKNTKKKYCSDLCRKTHWRLTNPEKQKASEDLWKQTNPEKRKQSSNTYRKKNLPYYASMRSSYRYKIKQATPKWANRFFIAEIYELAQLRTKITGISWEVDHIIPVKSNLVCGLHVEHNLQVVPADWNRKKRNSWDCEKGVQTWLSYK